MPVGRLTLNQETVVRVHADDQRFLAEVAQLVRAAACQAAGRGFESHSPLQNNALVEKLVYSLGLDPRPSGVSVRVRPGAPKYWPISSVVEHLVYTE